MRSWRRFTSRSSSSAWTIRRIALSYSRLLDIDRRPSWTTASGSRLSSCCAAAASSARRRKRSARVGWPIIRQLAMIRGLWKKLHYAGALYRSERSPSFRVRKKVDGDRAGRMARARRGDQGDRSSQGLARSRGRKGAGAREMKSASRKTAARRSAFRRSVSGRPRLPRLRRSRRAAATPRPRYRRLGVEALRQETPNEARRRSNNRADDRRRADDTRIEAEGNRGRHEKWNHSAPHRAAP